MQDLPETSDVTIHDQSGTSTTSLEDLPGTSDMQILNLPGTSDTTTIHTNDSIELELLNNPNTYIFDGSELTETDDLSHRGHFVTEVYVETTSSDSPTVGTSSLGMEGIDVIIHNPVTLNNGHHLDGRMDMSSVEKFIEIIESYAIRNEQEINELQTLLDHIFSDDPALASTAEMKIKTYISRMEITECESACWGMSTGNDHVAGCRSAKIVSDNTWARRCYKGASWLPAQVFDVSTDWLPRIFDIPSLRIWRRSTISSWSKWIANRTGRPAPDAGEITTVDLTAVTDKASKMDWKYSAFRAIWIGVSNVRRPGTMASRVNNSKQGIFYSKVGLILPERPGPRPKVSKMQGIPTRVLAWPGLIWFSLPYSCLTICTRWGRKNQPLN